MSSKRMYTAINVIFRIELSLLPIHRIDHDTDWDYC